MTSGSKANYDTVNFTNNIEIENVIGYPMLLVFVLIPCRDFGFRRKFFPAASENGKICILPVIK